jgi:hypothetical protein
MPRFRRLLSFIPALPHRNTANRVASVSSAPFATLVLLTFVTSTAHAQSRGAPATPLHVTVNSFEFVALSDTQPPAKPLNVHNGGTARFTDVRLTKVAYAGSPRGAAWLVALPRQTAVAPDELATVGMLCVDAAGLPVGTYRATAAVRAREVPEPVAIAVTLIVKGSGARSRHAPARCGTAVTK